MIVYGKASRPVAVAVALAEVEGWLARALSASLPVERHAAWTSALVAAGGLAQGLADGEDVGDGAPMGDASDGEAAAMALCHALAAVMGRSWDSAFAALPRGVPDAVTEALARLKGGAHQARTIVIRRTEGFAHYAVYPEAFWRAARAIAPPRPARVMGIRSIGTVLASAVAAALEAPVPVTVRPRGHPFARVVTPSPRLDTACRGDADAIWAIVDEGPGLSGSSVGSAADALRDRGVPPERIVLFPSHAGPPGAAASAAHRGLWAAARSATVSFEDLLLTGSAPGRGLADWVGDITGPLLAPPRDVAGGAWRHHLSIDETAWPAVDRQNERRKVLLDGTKGRFLLRFTGLGTFGAEKFARARTLAAAGFGVAPLAWRHGFLVEPWRDDLRPVTLGEVDRAAFLDRVAAYLAFRVVAFPADRHDGAPLEALLAMACANIAEAVAEHAADRLAPWAERLPALSARARPIAIDGRLAPHEWLHDGHGLVLKTDALDHCAAHDLVGCQDVAWDIAGAASHYALSDGETEALRLGIARRSGHAADPVLVAFLRIAYPAFRLGALTMARGRETGSEADRLSTAIAIQRAILRQTLDRSASAVG